MQKRDARAGTTSEQLTVLPASDPRAPGEDEYDLDFEAMRRSSDPRIRDGMHEVPGKPRVVVAYTIHDEANASKKMVAAGPVEDVMEVLVEAGYLVSTEHPEEDEATAEVRRISDKMVVSVTEPEPYRFEIQLGAGNAVDAVAACDGEEWPEAVIGALSFALTYAIMEAPESEAAHKVGPIVDGSGAEVAGPYRMRVSINNEVVRETINRVAAEANGNRADVVAASLRWALAMNAYAKKHQQPA